MAVAASTGVSVTLVALGMVSLTAAVSVVSTRATMPELSGGSEPRSSFSSSMERCVWRILPMALPATPPATAPARSEGGKMTPSTMPAPMPHLRPFLVLCSVIFWVWILPSASARTTATASIFRPWLISASRSAS